jgi:IclR family KDG regulon transcriptional repressor
MGGKITALKRAISGNLNRQGRVTFMSGDGTVGKACDVLDQVASYPHPVRFGQLLETSVFPKATLYRFLQTLVSQGMLSYDPDRQTYALGMRLVRLAHAAWTHSSLAPIARVYLDQLSQDVGETVHLAQMDSSQVLYVDKRNASQPVEMYSQAGKVGPAYCTGVGKAMMAYLPDDELAQVIAQQSFHRFTEGTLTSEATLREELEAIKKRGYAFDREEHEPGIICIAMPILTDRGRVLGALSVTGPTMRRDLKQLEALAPKLANIANQISADAQAWRFPDSKQQMTKAG